MLVVTSPAAGAESWYGMPVLGMTNGHRIVDIRPVLASMDYQPGASWAWDAVSTASQLVYLQARPDQATWQYNSGINVQCFFVYPQPFPAPAIWSMGMYYENGRWVGARTGATREGVNSALADFHDGLITPGAALLDSPWATPWSRDLPTVAVCFPDDGSLISVGVAVNDGPPESTVPPTNTYTLIQADLNWHQARDDAVQRGGNLATFTSWAEWSRMLDQIGPELVGKNVWIGGTDEGDEGHWRWVTGEPWCFSNWGWAQPDNANGTHHHTCIWDFSGELLLWADKDNVARSYYVLETGATGGAPEPEPEPSTNRYELVQATLTWDAAKADAESRGGHLATFADAGEWASLVADIGPQLTDKAVWIGATDEGDEGHWRWITGEPWGFSNWLDGQPNNRYEIQHCARLVANGTPSPQWDDEAGGVSFPYYLLEREIDDTDEDGLTDFAERYEYHTDPGNPDTDGDGILDGIEIGGYGSRYQIVNAALSWHAARADAEARGGHLATVTNEAEWATILARLGAALRDKSVWIGGTDEHDEGHWRWITGEPWTFANWLAGQPNNRYDAQHYVHVVGALGDTLPWDDELGAVEYDHYLLETPVFTSPLVFDSDGDGAGDGAEWRAGTDAWDAQSCFALSPAEMTGDGIVLRWASVPGRTYAIERRSPELSASFERVAEDLAATPPENTFVDPDGRSGAAFLYRILAAPAP